jgi:hypothetical protein
MRPNDHRNVLWIINSETEWKLLKNKAADKGGYNNKNSPIMLSERADTEKYEPEN